MLIIRREQFEAFRRSRIASFIRSITSRIEADPPPEARRFSAPERARIIEQGVGRAIVYDLRTPTQITAYLTLAFEFGVEFDRSSWARPILEDPELQAAARLELLLTEAAGRRQPAARSAASGR